MKTDNGTVYVVDDDDLFRRTLERMILKMGFSVEGFCSAEAFIQHFPVRHPACLVLDVFLPGIDGLALQERFLGKEGMPPIVFITGHGDIPMSVKAVKNGAEDFLLKPFDAEDLLGAITRALVRDRHVEEQEIQKRKIQSLINKLTPREQDVMREIITGKLNKQIGADLGIEEKTVRIHRSRLMRKLKMSSVADLVRTLEKVGIVHELPINLQ